MAEPTDARLEDIVRHGAGAPELNVVCCDSMDLEVHQDVDDHSTWCTSCGSCGATVAYVVDRHPVHTREGTS